MKTNSCVSLADLAPRSRPFGCRHSRQPAPPGPPCPQLRNTAMLPLFPDSVPPSVSGSKFLTANGQTLRLADADAYSRVLWLNDIFWCAEDMARLLQHKADIVCGLDYTVSDRCGT